MNDSPSQEIASRPRMRMRIFTVLALAWCATFLLLCVCQLVGLPLAIVVHPTGEDRVWTDLLEHSGKRTAQAFWAIASRNPLAPWWYEAFSPLIQKVPGGLYVARKLLDLFLACSVALFINELFRGRRPALALGFGLLVLIWNFSGYIEQVLFVMLVALGFSVLSLHFYLCYLNSRRLTAGWLVLSLLAFLIALATYSIQCGVPLAIALFGAAYGRKALPPHARSGPLAIVSMEVAFFAAIFLVFTLIWITTSGPTSSYFKLDIGLFLKHFAASIANHAWHRDTTDLLSSLLSHWSVLAIAPIAIAAGLVCHRLMGAFARKYEPLQEADEPRPWWAGPVVLALLAVSCLVIPTIALESTSEIWFPGSRSRMVQQVFQPVAYLALLALLASYLERRFALRRPLFAGIAVLCAFGFVVGLEYNRQLAALSNYEQGLTRGLKQLVPVITRTTRFFVRLDNDAWIGGWNPELNRILIKQAYKARQPNGITLDAIYKDEGDPVVGGFGSLHGRRYAAMVTLGPDEKGIYCPSVRAYVPYAEAVFAAYDGVTVTALKTVDRTTFAGFKVRFDRADAWRGEAQSSALPGLLAFDFDTTPPGSGWSVPERSAGGESFVWMAAESATITLGPVPAGATEVGFRTLQPIAPEIGDSLTLTVRDMAIPLTIVDRQGGGREYSASIPQGGDAADGRLTLVFSVGKTVVPQGEDRQLAIPFDWIRVKRKP